MSFGDSLARHTFVTVNERVLNNDAPPIQCVKLASLASRLTQVLRAVLASYRTIGAGDTQHMAG